MQAIANTIESTVVEFIPALIEVAGKSKVERQMSVVTQASGACHTALVGMKGKVGNAVRASIARAGLEAVAKAAAHNNYRPAAEYFAARLGEPIAISNRSSFEALPDLFQARIMKAKLAKNGGMREDKKTGALVAGSALSLAMELKAIAVELVAAKEEIRAQLGK